MKRAVRFVIRLAAAGIVVIGGMYLGLEAAKITHHRIQAAEPSAARILLSSLAVTGGLVLFATSSKVARWLTDDFDE